VQDDKGSVLVALARGIIKATTQFYVELMAFAEGLHCCLKQNFTKVIIESDC
jgi:ribonuclease HI